MRKLMFIINPVAGRGMFKLGLGDALHTLYLGGYEPTLFFTTRKGEAIRLAADNAENFDLVCCLGGDGTLSDVVAGLMMVPNPPPIGYFPLGTANDVATTLRLPKNDLAAAARLVVDGTPMDWDVGALGEHDFFTYVAAFGAFTDVSYETPQQRKQALGNLAYILEGMNRLPHLPHYITRVELDGDRVFEGDFIVGGVTNSTSVAGMIKLDPSRVRLDDGRFEVTMIRYPESLSDMNTLMGEFVGQKYDGEFIKVVQASRAKFIFSQEVPWTRDGESGGRFTSVTLENRPQAVRIIV